MDVVRALIERVPEPEGTGEQAPAEPKSQQIKIRLTAGECAEIDRRASGAGMVGRASWVAALTRANLQSETVFTDDEINALRATYRQLAHVGGNLNQIAHALNIDPLTLSRPEDRLLRELMAAVADIRAELVGVFKAASRRWSV